MDLHIINDTGGTETYIVSFAEEFIQTVLVLFTVIQSLGRLNKGRFSANIIHIV